MAISAQAIVSPIRSIRRADSPRRTISVSRLASTRWSIRSTWATSVPLRHRQERQDHPALHRRGQRAHAAQVLLVRRRLLSAATCSPLPAPRTFKGVAGSNTGEMFYLLAPDPTGAINGNVGATGFVDSVTTSVLAHEFQHLINASRRLYVTRTSPISRSSGWTKGWRTSPKSSCSTARPPSRRGRTSHAQAPEHESGGPAGRRGHRSGAA